MRLFNLMALLVLIVGLALSGCAEPSEKKPADQISSPEPSTSATSATPAPTEDLMEGEISTIDSDMAELEDLLTELEAAQNLSFDELEELNF